VDDTARARVGLTLFDTAVGRCGTAWSSDALLAVQLPGVDDAATSAALVRHVTRLAPVVEVADAPAHARDAIDRMVALLDGEADDLRTVALDLDAVAPFERAVYDATRLVPPGTTTTYGEIAREIGQPGAARAVGRALGHNPFPIVVPCHRVLTASGGTGGFSAPGGTRTKLRMLAIEGAPVRALREPPLFDVD
jgi:methylated-DNA-[protein]-cysteine S-methyltransferase